MNAFKKARKFIAERPSDTNAQILSRLVLSLESEAAFDLKELYELNYETFELALEILRDWRLDRYYAGKARLFDMSQQVITQPAPAHPAKAAAKGSKSSS